MWRAGSLVHVCCGFLILELHRGSVPVQLAVPERASHKAVIADGEAAEGVLAGKLRVARHQSRKRQRPAVRLPHRGGNSLLGSAVSRRNSSTTKRISVARS